MSSKAKDIFSETLIKLLDINPFKKISISKICENTPLVRKTFYNNFDSKEDVIEYEVEKNIKEYINLLENRNDYTIKEASMVYFTFWLTRKKFLEKLVDNDLLHLIQRQVAKYIDEIYKFVPSQKLDQLGEETLKYIYNFYSAGLCSLLNSWAKSGFEESPKELSLVFNSITEGIN